MGLDGPVSETIAIVVALGGLGLVVGAALERSHFCTMGAVADFVLFRSLRRARWWLLALATTLVTLQGAWLGGLIDPAALTWPRAHLGLALTGGILFGVGMVLGGGCASRLVVRAASGQVKAMLALLAMAKLAALTVLVLPPEATAVGGPSALAILTLAIGLGALAWCARHVEQRQLAGLMTAGLLGVAMLAVLGATGALGTALPLNFVPITVAAPVSAAQTAWLAVLVGTVAGAAISAGWAGRWRFDPARFDDDTRRHLLGGAAMGIGGAAVGGCTLGAGIGGAAMLAPAAWAGLFGMIAGSAWMVHVLATGGWGPAWRTLWSRA